MRPPFTSLILSFSLSTALSFHPHVDAQLDPRAEACTPNSGAAANRFVSRACTSSAWNVSAFTDFVTFGDSYTDENRFNYFAEHNGQAPPAGTFLPESFNTAGGGRTWARYVVQYTGKNVNNKWTPQLTLYDYAVEGAVCDNSVSPRIASSINEDFPALRQYEIPAFLQDRGTKRNGTNTPYFSPLRSASNTVYSIWDGTNDVGVGAFFQDSQLPGHSLLDYLDCLFDQYDSLYAAGGRYFVLMNLAPLDLAPLYANASEGGIGPNLYWETKPGNLTAIAEHMREDVLLLNRLFYYRVPLEVLINKRYPGAHFAHFDVHRLLSNIHANPASYLNGSAPANATGYVNHCSISGTNCVRNSSPDSFLWFDPLHPSEQTDRIIAREFVSVLSGNGSYATYYDG